MKRSRWKENQRGLKPLKQGRYLDVFDYPAHLMGRINLAPEKIQLPLSPSDKRIAIARCPPQNKADM
jgi:hypothetical protein